MISGEEVREERLKKAGHVYLLTCRRSEKLPYVPVVGRGCQQERLEKAFIGYEMNVLIDFVPF